MRICCHRNWDDILLQLSAWRGLIFNFCTFFSFSLCNNLIINANEIPPSVIISETEVDLGKNVDKALKGIKGKESRREPGTLVLSAHVTGVVSSLMKCILN